MCFWNMKHLLHTFEDPPFLLPIQLENPTQFHWPLFCFPCLHRIPVNSQSNTLLSSWFCVNPWCLLLSHEGKFVFPKEFQTPQSRHSDASRWLDQIFMKRSHILATVQETILFSGLPLQHAHSNMVAGWVIFPRPRGLGQTGLNHFAIDSKI